MATTSEPSQPPIVMNTDATTPVQTDFQRLGTDRYQAELRVSEPDTPFEFLKRRILGTPIPEQLSEGQRLNKVRALAILSSDGLSSVAYATEASLAVLVVAGASAFTANIGIGIVTAILMLIVGTSYRQTIKAYPNGGGSYTVAKQNLGTIPGLVAAASLLVDYLLTVSVSVAAGINAIASVFPEISHITVELDIVAIILITGVNLRGLKESGTVFAAPTYVFLLSFGLMIVFGLFNAVAGGLGNRVTPPPQVFHSISEPLTLLLLLTAFASGCSAMTGVEAISNGVPIFEGKEATDQAKNARTTLTIMITLLATFFLGTTYLAWRSGAVPYTSGTPTVTSQIAHFAFTGAFGWMVYVVQTATLFILIFAANTSFAGFPRLASLLAQDTYLPAMFGYRGERIAFNVGIVTLGVLSSILLIIFRGSVNNLINLYALGVFTAFTLSQAGMVIHWRNNREPGWRLSLIPNAIGSVATGVVTIVIAITKFDRGAWVVLIIIPVLVFTFLAIQHYYGLRRVILATPQQVHKADVVVIPIISHQSLHKTGTTDLSSQANRHEVTWSYVLLSELEIAASIAPELIIMRVVMTPEEGDEFRAMWEAYFKSLPKPQSHHIVTILSPYRTIVLPLSNFIIWYKQQYYMDKKVAVILPREENPQWWEWPLQRRISSRIKQRLEDKQHVKDTNLIVEDLPYTLTSKPADTAMNATT